MSFFSKLFGGFSDSGNTGGSSGILRTSRQGGYDKMELLTAIDRLNSEILALTEASAAKAQGKPYTVPDPAPDLPLSRVKAGGFDEADADAYIAELRAKIEELRQSL